MNLRYNLDYLSSSRVGYLLPVFLAEAIIAAIPRPQRASESNVGDRIFSVIFEPLTQIHLSRSTAKITAHIDLRKYEQNIVSLEGFIKTFRQELYDPSVYAELLFLSKDPGMISLNRGFGSYPFPSQIRDTEEENNLKNCTTQYGKRMCHPLKLLATYREEVDNLLTFVESVIQRFRMTVNNFTEGNAHRRKREVKEHQILSDIDKISPYLWGSLTGDQRKNQTVVEAFVDLHGKPKPINGAQIKLLDEILSKLEQTDPELHRIISSTPHREKRSALFSLIFGIGIYKNRKAIKQLRKEISHIKRGLLLHDRQIQELHRFVNIMSTHISVLDQAVMTLDLRTLIHSKNIHDITMYLEKIFALLDFTKTVEHNFRTLRDAIQKEQYNHEGLYELLRLMSFKRLNTVAVPPHLFKKMLSQLKEDLRTNLRLKLPYDPEEDIWFYYEVAKVTPLLLDEMLLIMIDIPLVDTTLTMEVFQIYNLPKTDETLQMQYTYQIEGEYLAISDDDRFVTIPDKDLIHICMVTQGHICILESALYPAEKVNWCIYALFTKNLDQITTRCKKDYEDVTTLALNLRGYIWAISTTETERLQINCPNETLYQTIKPPITIVHVGNGCAGYSPNVNIPAKSEFSSTYDDDLRRDFFLEYNSIYQNINFTFSDFNISLQGLSSEEIKELRMQIEELPPLNEKLLNQRVNLIHEKWNKLISPKLLLIIIIISAIMVVGMIVTAVIGLLLKLRGVQKIIPEALKNKLETNKLVEQFFSTLQQNKNNTITTTAHGEVEKPSTSKTPIQERQTQEINTITPLKIPGQSGVGITEIPAPEEGHLEGVKFSTETLEKALAELKAQGFSSPRVEKYKKFLKRKGIA